MRKEKAQQMLGFFCFDRGLTYACQNRIGDAKRKAKPLIRQNKQKRLQQRNKKRF
jgi:hypothetical protein